LPALIRYNLLTIQVEGEMNRLKEFREEAMMTVRELSERSGVSEDTITKIENGHRKGRGMTLRKLARALGVKLHQLSPEHFERTTNAEAKSPEILPSHGFGSSEEPREDSLVPEVDQDADILNEAISRVYEVMRAIDQPVEKSPQQRSYPDGVPRMNISERQQKVLIMVLECGEVDPSTVADRLEINVGTAYRELSVLEEHGLVFADESGKRLISPIGTDLGEAIVKGLVSPFGGDAVETIVNTRSRLWLDEALSQILILKKVYDSVGEFDPYGATDEDIASFFRLQELIIQSLRRIAALTVPAGEVEQKDAADYAQSVQSVMRLLMSNPPALSRIREDLEDFTKEQIYATLDIVMTIPPIANAGSDPYQKFRSLLLLKTGSSPTRPYGTEHLSEPDSAQHARMRDTD
jgi:transcriptional regulator with XRE-family HTH domain